MHDYFVLLGDLRDDALVVGIAGLDEREALARRRRVLLEGLQARFHK